MQRDVIDNYEDFLIYVEEIQDSLRVIHDWLSVVPDFDRPETYCDLITYHRNYFAILNLIMCRLDNLIEEHKENIYQ